MTLRLRAAFVAAAGLVAAAVASSHAAAQPSPQDSGAAEALFRDARQLALSGKIPEACVKFAESQRLDPRVGTLIYLATCHEQEGKTATAWAEFNDAIAQAHRAGLQDREAQARERAALVEQKLSYVVIQVDAPELGVIVRIDGREIRAFGTRLPLDPGSVAMDAGAPGKKPWRQSLVIPAGPSEQTVRIPRLESEAALVPAAPVKPLRSPPPPESPTHGSTQRIAGAAVAGLGVAGIAVGAVFGFRAKSQYDAANGSCDGSYCTDEGLAGHDDANRSATVSTIAFGVGIAAIGVATVLILTSFGSPPGRRSVRSSSPRAAPSTSSFFAPNASLP
jgi:hypothetical protein